MGSGAWRLQETHGGASAAWVESSVCPGGVCTGCFMMVCFSVYAVMLEHFCLSLWHLTMCEDFEMCFIFTG